MHDFLKHRYQDQVLLYNNYFFNNWVNAKRTSWTILSSLILINGLMLDPLVKPAKFYLVSLNLTRFD
jgi:hypothetical protein